MARFKPDRLDQQPEEETCGGHVPSFLELIGLELGVRLFPRLDRVGLDKLHLELHRCRAFPRDNIVHHLLSVLLFVVDELLAIRYFNGSVTLDRIQDFLPCLVQTHAEEV